MRIYGLSNCDSCRVARKALPEAEFVDVVDPGVLDAHMQLAVDSCGDVLINKRSTTWKQMSDEEKALPATVQLERFPKVMKRPLIIADGKAYVGWGADVKKALLE